MGTAILHINNPVYKFYSVRLSFPKKKRATVPGPV